MALNVCAQFQIWVLPVQTAFIVRGTKSIRAIAQTLAIASTTIWNVLKNRETTDVLSNRPRTGRPRKTSVVDDRNIVTDVKKDPKTTVSVIRNNLQRAGVKVSQSTVRRRLHEQKYRGYTWRCKPLISKKNRRQASKILGQSFMDWWDKDWPLPKWLERLKFGGKKDLLMIPNIKAHLKPSGGNVMAWACIASSGTDSLILTDYVTHDGSSKMNSEVYRNILSANLQKDATKLIGRSFIMQQDNDPKHSAKATKSSSGARSGRF